MQSPGIHRRESKPERSDIPDQIARVNLQPVLDFVAKRRTSALVIMHDGRIAAERYLLGWDAQAAVPLTSASKSIVSVLAGILLKQGAIRDFDQSVADFLTEWRGDNRAAFNDRYLPASITI